MRFAAGLLIFVMGSLLFAVIAIFVASEMSGEVVRMRSFDANGRHEETRLWAVDYGDHTYLRGRPASGWYRRVVLVPEVELERGGEVQRFRVVPSKHLREPINELMSEKYGLGDQLIAVIRDMNEVVPLRLDSLGP